MLQGSRGARDAAQKGHLLADINAAKLQGSRVEGAKTGPGSADVSPSYLPRSREGTCGSDMCRRSLEALNRTQVQFAKIASDEY